MKSGLLSASLGALALLCSCSDALREQGEPAAEAVILKAAVDALPTRTWLDTGAGGTPLAVYWSDGDRIDVNGQASSPLSVEDGAKVREAAFALRSVEPPYRAVYPASSVVATAYGTDGTATVHLPSVQPWKASGFADGTAVLYAYAPDAAQPLAFHNLCAAIRVRLTDPAATVVVEASLTCETLPVCGDGLLAPETGSFSLPEGGGTLSLDLGDGVTLAAGGTDFYFLVPGGEYPDLSFSFVRAGDRRTMLCRWTPSGALERGHLYCFEPTAFAPGAKDIESVEEWEEFAAAANAGDDLSKFLYKDGTVRLGADLVSADLTPVEDWRLAFDGQGHTLTRTAAARPLFRGVGGSVRNLVTAGTLTGSAPLADTLRKGGTLVRCTNRMTVTADAADDIVASGLVRILCGGRITGCANEGAVSVTVDCTGGVRSVQAAGLVGVAALEEDALIEDCTNTGGITLAPVIPANTGNAMLTGLGGIVGWHRNPGFRLTLGDCTNEGRIFYDAARIAVAGKTAATCVGGIIGNAAPVSTANGYLNTPSASNGLALTLTDCTNRGNVDNQAICQVLSQVINAKVYSGGIAGAVLGTQEAPAVLTGCADYGAVTPYDVAGGSDRAAFCGVVGGLVGWGGYVTLSGCTVNARLGTLVRQSVAVGGGIGAAVAPFRMDGCRIFARVNLISIAGWTLNRSLAACVLAKYNNTATTPAVSVTGSVLENCRFGGTYKGTAATLPLYTDTSDWSNRSELAESTLFNAANYASNLVCGHGYTDVSKDVTVTGCSWWDGQ